MASLCNMCVCVCVCVCVSVLCALCSVLCAVGCFRINQNRILMVFCSFLVTKNERKEKEKTRTKKRKEKKRKEKKKRKVWVCWGGRGGWCALYISFLFFFLTAFPTRCQCRGALLASHAAWRNTCPPSIWWGTQPPIRMKMDSNCAQLLG